MLRVGGNANISVFRYQHVFIGTAKLWRWGSKPTPVPDAYGFASQWNIGLKAHSTGGQNIIKSATFLCKFVSANF